MNALRWPAWAEISREDLLRWGLLLPRPGQRVPRKILRVPHPELTPPPPQPMCWSGERARELTVQIFSKRGRLLSYCRRGDGWTTDSRRVYG